ncbi:MAG: alpha-amylase family glycosyl hydrolase [Saprospiraceae bacterium]
MVRIILFLVFCISFHFSEAQTSFKKKTVFQGFWWDYENNNYPDGWANYLVDLAPRLKSMGIDAIWIPPSIKNQFFGQKGVGYAPFDHYDLGDKFQKSDEKTRLGSKDELLRLVAVLHANGIEVIQDIVPNHIIGAGSDTGAGGQDPSAPEAPCTDKWKNFRYSCWATPSINNSETTYLAKQGRWPKNHQNFHPIVGCNYCDLCDANNNPICWQGFGPDVAYDDCAHGYSSNATYNSNQSTYSPYRNGGIGVNNGYMRKGLREWLVWYKKQLGFNGVRIDAVKHFQNAVSTDFLWNLQNMASWASATDTMLAVGEWVGGKTELDNWTLDVEERSGTFDFGLRAFDGSGGLYSMIYGNGAYAMNSLPNAQQNRRYITVGTTRIHRTVPFVNNHDTYRPTFGPTGNITGWNGGSELSPHVDPREPRLGSAYAVMHSMDGNPQAFFEDVFNLANTGQRWTHNPNNSSQLPVHSDLANIIRLHGALDFKSGSYKVPSSLPTFWNNVTSSTNNEDILVVERSQKAIICTTDQWNVDQDVWIDTDFAVGTILKDYSGGFVSTTTVTTPQNQGEPNRVRVYCRGVGYPSYTYSSSYSDHGLHYHGYAIWAPVDKQAEVDNYTRGPITTTQEWEMEDDLGDSHCASLVQGGRLPANDCSYRIVGKIFPKALSTVQYEFFEDDLETGIDNCLEFYFLHGEKIHCHCAIGDFSGSFVVDSTGWIVAKIRHNPGDGCNHIAYCGQAGDCSGKPSQKANIKLSYHAPENVSSSLYPSDPSDLPPFWTGAAGDHDYSSSLNWEKCNVPDLTGGKQILFVNGLATGLQNGTSWTNAFTSVEKALQVATFCDNIDEIWVAEGTYLPNTNHARDQYFTVPPGTTMYGGFTNVGNPVWNDRNPTTYVTILNGDVGVSLVENDNTFHVVNIPIATDTTIVDGFTIKFGYADGLGSLQNVGGGILNQGVLKLKNIVIQSCFSSAGPSAILNKGNSAYLELENVLIENNNSMVDETVKNIENSLLHVISNFIIVE